MKKIYGTFGVEMRAYGQKLVKFCTHTHTHTHTHTRVSYSSIDGWKPYFLEYSLVFIFFVIFASQYQHSSFISFALLVITS